VRGADRLGGLRGLSRSASFIRTRPRRISLIQRSGSAEWGGPVPTAMERVLNNEHYDASYVLERGTALAAPRSPGENMLSYLIGMEACASGAGTKTWRQAICRQPRWAAGIAALIRNTGDAATGCSRTGCGSLSERWGRAKHKP
jgi:hypothetical protein